MFNTTEIQTYVNKNAKYDFLCFIYFFLFLQNEIDSFILNFKLF